MLRTIKQHAQDGHAEAAIVDELLITPAARPNALCAIKNPRKLMAVALIAAACCFTPSKAPAQIFISVRIGPPALPVYVQPPCQTPGYLWNPGYWAYGSMGYYWVPGVWVAPPQVGLLWTPGYWGFASGLYGWHTGYWGPHVGFYGGVNYGFGYGGFGFVGGGWSGGVFRYNSAVSNVNTTVIRNVYVDRTVINNTTIVNNRASFNGPGGVMARPTPQERAFANEQHVQVTPNQLAHQQTASLNRNQFASLNGGHPMVASMDRVNGHAFNPQARMAEQQQRIGQGVTRGQLSPGQTAHLERREQNVQQQVHADRQANGGRLTPQEHKQVNREQNRTSHEIHAERHEPH
jgi:hypothetical protein